MFVTGIVAEYNPFHNGHLYQLNETKKKTSSDFIIAVMSGNFTQRGLPSIVNKFVRTQMALSCGIDMVLELPAPFAAASAERFCEASVSILNKTGLVDAISFGSELGEIDLLQAIARVLVAEPSQLSLDIKSYLSQGYSFPKARQAALTAYFSKSKAVHSSVEQLKNAVENPNNILGIEYIKALIKYNAPITPLTIKRQGSNYHDTQIYSSMASATAIRTQFSSGDTSSIKGCMPLQNYNLLMQHTHTIPALEDLSDFLHYKLIFSNKSSLYSLWDIPKDIILSILNCFTKKLSILEIIDEVTSKTYTRATVQRALFRIILNVLQSDMDRLKALEWIPYIRVLGCRKNAAVLLSEMTKRASVPVITNLKTAYPALSQEAHLLLDYEIKAGHIYHYISKNASQYHQDFTHPFIKL